MSADCSGDLKCSLLDTGGVAQAHPLRLDRHEIFDDLIQTIAIPEVASRFQEIRVVFVLRHAAADGVLKFKTDLTRRSDVDLGPRFHIDTLAGERPLPTPSRRSAPDPHRAFYC